MDKLEAIARIISPSAMKSIETIREEWTTWIAAQDFGDGPHKVDKLKLTESVVQDEWDELQPKRLRALKKAGEILALHSSTPANGEQVERIVEQAVEAWHNSDATLPEWLGWTDAEYAAWCADPNAVPRLPKYFAAATLPTPTEDARERVKVLEEALDWAIAEIEGRTRYDPDFYTGREQRNNSLAKAKEALGDYVPPSLRTALGNKETDRHG